MTGSSSFSQLLRVLLKPRNLRVLDRHVAVALEIVFEQVSSELLIGPAADTEDG